MDKKKIEIYARELFEAERSRLAAAPFTERDPLFGVDEAYQVQLANVSRVLAMGQRISGKKIGLTSLAMQEQLGVGEPDYGHLFEAMDCPDGFINTGALIQPKIEAELAFVLKKDLRGGQIRVDDVDEATDYVVGAFEIVDSRVADWRIKLADTVADNASSGRYILGETRIKPKSIDLAGVTMKLFQSSNLVGEGLGAAVLGDPRIAVAWLANKLWSYGVALESGEVVLSGAFSAAPAARKGDVFRAEFSNFGCVEARFV
ncbi:MAG: fumarylacetoacetate hydrolase family protein [Clostridiales bacterium]|jgi:2-keto-4-pentenoate hydratase|nr:fumarylacetoacetate hydrolase family protein [Clostridiales bacterium]